MMILFFGGVFIMMPIISVLSDDDPRGYLIILFLITFALAAFPLTKLYELTFGRRKARKQAARFKAMVEGSFLRIIDLDTDKKIHFLQVVDYQTDRSGYSKDTSTAALQMNTNSGGTLLIPAVKDALRMRDLLAEVDSQREQSSH